jgi:hypothetical protein
VLTLAFFILTIADVSDSRSSRFAVRVGVDDWETPQYTAIMSDDFTTALERELQRLNDELRQDPRFRRMSQIQTLLADYRNGASKSAAAAETVVSPQPAPVRTGRRRRVHLSKAASVRSAVKSFLLDKGTVHRSEILKYLMQQQLMGHEKNPMASLAAYLSDWKNMFQPDGRGNFTLKKSTERGGDGRELTSH